MTWETYLEVLRVVPTQSAAPPVGGKYRAEKQGDGTWTIRDVPIFAELPAGTRRNRDTISSDWMSQVIERHSELESRQKYLAPVHVNHHDTGRDTPRVGFLKPTRVGKIPQDGKSVAALFADITSVKEEDVDRFVRLELPYRSAEINSNWRPEIASVALSEDEAPHFKLPMLSVEKVGEAKHTKLSELLAFTETANVDDDATFTFKLGDAEAFVCKDCDDGVKKESREALGDEKDFPADTDGDGDTDDNDNNVPDGLEAKINAQVKAMVPQMIDAIVKGAIAKLGGQDEQQNELDELGSGDQPVMPRPTFTEDTKMNDENIKLSARVAALEDKQASRDETDRIAGLVMGAVDKLSEEGWNIGDAFEGRLADIATNSKEPERAVEIFVESYKESTPKDLPANLSELASATRAPVPEEVEKFREDGPETFEKAIKLSEQYDELVSQGADLTIGREEFIEINSQVI